MPLSTTERVRYARQLSLVEIGERGQALLCAARPQVSPEAAPQAAAVALDYLARAGLGQDAAAPNTDRSPTDVNVAVAAPAQIQLLAGHDSLVHAAETLAGAFAAVEAIKAVLGAGAPATLPPLVLATDPPPRPGND